MRLDAKAKPPRKNPKGFGGRGCSCRVRKAINDLFRV